MLSQKVWEKVGYGYFLVLELVGKMSIIRTVEAIGGLGINDYLTSRTSVVLVTLSKGLYSSAAMTKTAIRHRVRQ